MGIEFLRALQDSRLSAPYRTEATQPVVNAVMGDLSQAMILQMAQLKVETEEALLHMEQVAPPRDPQGDNRQGHRDCMKCLGMVIVNEIA